MWYMCTVSFGVLGILTGASANFSVLDLAIHEGSAMLQGTLDIGLHAVNQPSNTHVLVSDLRTNLITSPKSVLSVTFQPQAQLHLGDISTGIDYFDRLTSGLSLTATMIPKKYDVTNLNFNTSFEWDVQFNAGALGRHVLLLY
jgi:hypothetical protein